MTVLKIGTRGSKLALTQCGWVQRRIVAALGEDVARADEVAPLTVITTQGDRIQDRRLIEAGGKALFTKEIEDALLRGDIDVAVHSLKDMPAADVPGLSLCAIPVREDPRDAFLSPNYETLADLPQGARLGTASMRRQAQALAQRPDLQVIMTRGNVDTRLAKLQAGACDALLLAAAGLNRLGLSHHIRSHIDPDLFASAPGQGALAIQCRTEDLGAGWMAKVHDVTTFLRIQAERGALEALEASCRTAVGAYATLENDQLALFVEALSADGSKRWQRRESLSAPTAQSARDLGLKLGHEIKTEAGPELIVS
ncbi:porphobilinogen deaminase [Asticcacaulis biprosthecium C19]|uniref:Porphobilinogen deaminase n=2 Tax=Asticcacaulis biprosthecium TaxID=76891 RepID=F4QI49_9CAUL|nr:hydroxymethylbilane synthase [Asticcacaulis biprosthecium]EGF92916.1 porphobilinogen deaminase [Asticcacaulis biprosthecium C19]